jgi:sulfate permease, SulP family
MESSKAFSDRLKTFIPKSIQCFREGYSIQGFLRDLFAGINVGILALPLAIAVSIGAGISPNHGLITAVVAGFLISLLGGSRVQVGGPTATLIVIMYGIMLRHGYEGMLMATFMAGVILIFFGLAGFGTYIKYIPHPVVTGLTTGMAVVIFSSQFKDFLGLDMGVVPLDFMAKWQAYWTHLRTFDFKILTIGLGTLTVLVYCKRYHPKLPSTLIALVIAGAIVWLFKIDIPTIESRYGGICCTFPSPKLPYFQFHELLDLVPDALTIAILCGIESLLSAVVAEGMTGWRHQSNCELVAQGIANIGSVLFGGLPATGSLTRTTANVKSGASTPIAGITHAIVLFGLLYYFSPLMRYIPLASLAAVLIMMAWNMSNCRHFFHLFTAPKKDVIVLIVVFFLTVLINITAAVQVGTILASFMFMKQMSDLSDVVSTPINSSEAPANPHIGPPIEVPPEIEIFDINGPLFFGVADRLKNLFNQLSTRPKIFILNMQHVPTIDASGMHALEEFYIECSKHHTVLLLSGVKKGPLKDLQRYHLDEMMGEDHIFSNLPSALEFSRELLRIEKFKRAMGQQIRPAIERG